MKLQLEIDCQTCRTQASMKPTTIHRFSVIIQFIGMILLIPCFLGLLICLFMIVGMANTPLADPKTASLAELNGQAAATGIGIIFVLIVGAGSLVSGLLGWLLLMKRKVFKCVRCGFILDRAQWEKNNENHPCLVCIDVFNGICSS